MPAAYFASIVVYTVISTPFHDWFSLSHPLSEPTALPTNANERQPPANNCNPNPPQRRTQVYIVGHIPPGSDERQTTSLPNGHTTFSEKNNLRYLRLVRKYSNIILGQFFGHLHSDSFRIIYNENGEYMCAYVNVCVWECECRFSVMCQSCTTCLILILYVIDIVIGDLLVCSNIYCIFKSVCQIINGIWFSISIIMGI